MFKWVCTWDIGQSMARWCMNIPHVFRWMKEWVSEWTNEWTVVWTVITGHWGYCETAAALPSMQSLGQVIMSGEHRPSTVCCGECGRRRSYPVSFEQVALQGVRTEPIGYHTPCVRYISKSEPCWRILGDAVAFKVWRSLSGKSPRRRCMGSRALKEGWDVLGGISGMRSFYAVRTI